jgi:hypothetical protein
MLTGKTGFTAMVTTLDAAGLPVAQVSLEPSTQLIVLLFAGVMV